MSIYGLTSGWVGYTLGMEDEKTYTLNFTETQLFNLQDILDCVLDYDIDMIENPRTVDEKSVSRETRVEVVDETMELFEIVKAKIDEIFAEEEI
jgi:hypothetical protein